MTFYKQLYNDFTTQVMGYSALGIILSTCLGSIAIMTILMNGYGFIEMLGVFAIVSVCSAHNAAILTVQKPRLIFHLLILSVIMSIVTILINGLIAII